MREGFVYFPPFPIKGRRECRAPDAPAVSCAMVVVRCAHEHSGHTGITRHSPRNGFNGYSVLAPVLRAFWPPSPALLLADLTPASGCQAHTASPSASSALVRDTLSVHRIPPRVDDVAQRPFGGAGREAI